MKTTIEIADPLLAEAKAFAAREKTTLRALIEEGLRQVLRRQRVTPATRKDFSFRGDGLTAELEARGGWSKIREAAYPGFFDEGDDEEDDDK